MDEYTQGWHDRAIPEPCEKVKKLRRCRRSSSVASADSPHTLSHHDVCTRDTCNVWRCVAGHTRAKTTDGHRSIVDVYVFMHERKQRTAIQVSRLVNIFANLFDLLASGALRVIEGVWSRPRPPFPFGCQIDDILLRRWIDQGGECHFAKCRPRWHGHCTHRGHTSR